MIVVHIKTTIAFVPLATAPVELSFTLFGFVYYIFVFVDIACVFYLCFSRVFFLFYFFEFANNYAVEWYMFHNSMEIN